MKCNAKDNELTNLINEREKTLSALQSDYSGLIYRRDKVLSDDAIEEYAKQNLGMQRRDNYQTKWFEVSWGDDFDD